MKLTFCDMWRMSSTQSFIRSKTLSVPQFMTQINNANKRNFTTIRMLNIFYIIKQVRKCQYKKQQCLCISIIYIYVCGCV